jgi:hypothetical protein
MPAPPSFRVRTAGGEAAGQTRASRGISRQGGNVRAVQSARIRSDRVSRIGQSAVAVALASAALLVIVGCGTAPPADWQWWRSADTAGVRAELAGWRGPLDGNQAFLYPVTLNLSLKLLAADSTSTTGLTIHKFAHLIAVRPEPAESVRADEYRFGVAVDTIAMVDTFCQVDYWDSLLAAGYRFTYDSLWEVTFRPDTQPDNTVLWRVDSSGLVGYATPQETIKTFDWSARRVVFLSKDSGAATYHLRRMSGFAAVSPGPQDAPSVTTVVMSRPGRVDTFFYLPRTDGRGLYNLRSVDSVCEVQAGDPIDVEVVASTPVDTTLDRNRFFLQAGASRTDITVGALRGSGSFTLADPGYQNVFIEVVPLSSLGYKDAAHVSTTWAVPVLVR